MFFFSSRRRHTRWPRDWSSDVCSSDLAGPGRWAPAAGPTAGHRPHVGQSSDAAPRPRRALSLASFCLASPSRNGDDLSMASLGSGSRVTRAHLVWAVGVFAYLCAVSGRASFGVASVEASERFGVDGAVLSLFGVVQLGTYAAAQIPAGLLLDRLGPRRIDRKSTRLNSSHVAISYAVFCLK